MSEQTVDTIRDKIVEILNSSGKLTVGEEGAFLTNFVLVAEYLDPAGQFYTWTVKDEEQPPWRTEGLLGYVIANEIYPVEETEGDE